MQAAPFGQGLYRTTVTRSVAAKQAMNFGRAAPTETFRINVCEGASSASPAG